MADDMKLNLTKSKHQSHHIITEESRVMSQYFPTGSTSTW